MGFHALTFAMSLGGCSTLSATDLMVIEGNLISQSYMAEMLRSVVLPFLCENLCKYQAYDDNAITYLTRISKFSFIRTMLCVLTGQCASQTCLQFGNVKDSFLT